jgi:dTDP-4-dehydrorhamnose 3,5-epimerase
MRLQETALPGAYLVLPTVNEDERGSFGRLFDAEIFRENGLEPDLARQSSYSYNVATGTLRGMHYQRAPWAEAKLVRCTRGRVFDVIVDIRDDSPTRLQHFAVELTDSNHAAVYVPKGFAHGFLTLTAEAELHYQISTPYNAESAAGLRWDDPALGLPWPEQPAVISQRDRDFPLIDA